jgi:hypothetical protein
VEEKKGQLSSEEQEEEEELDILSEEGEIEPRSQKALGGKGKAIRKTAKTSELIEIDSPTLVPKAISDEIKVWQTMGLSTDESKAISKKYALEFEDQSFSFKPPKLDNYVLRYAKDKDRLKSVCAAEEAHVATQLKIMDIAPPLVDLYCKVRALGDGEEETQAREAVQAVLQQWGRAFHHISQKRRRSVVSLVDPTYDFLLSAPSAYTPGKEAVEFLFTETFLESMLKEATQDSILASSAAAREKAKAGKKRETAHPSSSTRVLRPRRKEATHPFSDGRQRGSAGVSRSATSRSWLSGGSRYVESKIISRVNSSEPSGLVDRVGARLLDFAKNWKDVTNDSWVLESVSEGIKLDFVETPKQLSYPRPVAMSADMLRVCDQEVEDLLKKGAIVRVLDSGTDGFICSLFVIPKKSGGFRPIVNLKPLNCFIRYEHFKMENLDSARFILRKGDWMAKLDLKDAYLTVPVHPSHQKFLRFEWRGRIYQFNCLAFGLAPAPRCFSKILKVVAAHLRRQGLRMIVYLDDILIINSSKERTKADVVKVIELLQHLGFLINWEKSIVDPAQILEYLGLVVDSVRLSFALPQLKATSVKAMCDAALKKGCISLREIASIMGNFTWAIPTIPFAQAHFRRMQSFYIEQARRARFNLNFKCSLSEDAKQDLQWWSVNLGYGKDKAFFPEVPDLEIFSDASMTGWGAYCNGIRTRGSWTLLDTKKHINELELIAALYAVQAFTFDSRKISIRIYLDNMTAVAYINHGGGTRSKVLTRVSTALTEWCEQREIAINAVHLQGKLNVVADEESRAGPDAGDWRLKPSVFNKVQRIWFSKVDVFASHWNAQLPLFISWRPQPQAMRTDAFSVNWNGLAGYIFPPFALIFKCLEKIRREKADVVFVCPIWPGQPWFPVLLELACDVTLLLHQESSLLTSALQEPHPLLASKALHLAVWRLSGKGGVAEDFRRKWSTYSWPETGQERSSHTIPRGGIGEIGVWEGVRIPYRQL